MNDSSQKTSKKTLFTKLMFSIAATLVLASITHAHYFGYQAFVAFIIIAVVSVVLNTLSPKGNNRVLHVFSGLFNAWIIIGVGILNGFWNHLVKVLLTLLYVGQLPPSLGKLFTWYKPGSAVFAEHTKHTYSYLPASLAGLLTNPRFGSFISESAAILSFVTSMFALNYLYKIIKLTWAARLQRT
jgi:hypothetical protein